MAEGYAKKLLNSRDYIIQSAGIESHGLNPKAVQVMLEDGVDIHMQTSDVIDPVYFAAADLIITLCGDARDNCPVIPPTSTHLHWDLEDPAKATGTPEEVMDKFREVRDTIKVNILALAEAE